MEYSGSKVSQKPLRFARSLHRLTISTCPLPHSTRVALTPGGSPEMGPTRTQTVGEPHAVWFHVLPPGPSQSDVDRAFPLTAVPASSRSSPQALSTSASSRTACSTGRARSFFRTACTTACSKTARRVAAGASVLCGERADQRERRRRGRCWRAALAVAGLGGRTVVLAVLGRARRRTLDGVLRSCFAPLGEAVDRLAIMILPRPTTHTLPLTLSHADGAWSRLGIRGTAGGGRRVRVQRRAQVRQELLGLRHLQGADSARRAHAGVGRGALDARSVAQRNNVMHSERSRLVRWEGGGWRTSLTPSATSHHRRTRDCDSSARTANRDPTPQRRLSVAPPNVSRSCSLALRTDGSTRRRSTRSNPRASCSIPTRCATRVDVPCARGSLHSASPSGSLRMNPARARARAHDD